MFGFLPIIFPNPVSDILHIEALPNAWDKIYIIDALGRTLIREEAKSTIDVGNLIAGNYYIRFVAEEHELILPFVVVH